MIEISQIVKKIKVGQGNSCLINNGTLVMIVNRFQPLSQRTLTLAQARFLKPPLFLTFNTALIIHHANIYKPCKTVSSSNKISAFLPVLSFTISKALHSNENVNHCCIFPIRLVSLLKCYYFNQVTDKLPIEFCLYQWF